MLKVLVVEDKIVFRQMIVEPVSREFPDLEILEAGEGKEALRIVDEDHPFLVFMDIHLPGENGLDLTRKIKEKHPETVVVMLTNHDIPEYRDAAQRAGASHFLCKWFINKHDLLELFHTILSERVGKKPIIRRDENAACGTRRRRSG